MVEATVEIQILKGVEIEVKMEVLQEVEVSV